MISRLRDTVRVLLGRARFEREMDEEMTAHIAMVADDLAARVDLNQVLRGGVGRRRGVE